MSDQARATVATLRRVLVADNDAIIRSVLRSLLSKIGQSVEQVGASDEALRCALATPFSLVILDLDMAPDGGLYVCRKLRAQPGYADVPVVILTALDNADARDRSLRAGATRFVAKPFNPAELMRLLLPYLDVAEPDAAQLAEILNGDRGLRLRDAVSARAGARFEAY